jgi:hypothetical protein
MGVLFSGLEVVLYMGNRLKVYYDFLVRLPHCLARTNFEAALLKLQVKLLSFLAKAIILYPKNPIVRSWEAIWGADDVDAFDADCRAIALQAETDAGNCDREITSDMMTKLEGLEAIKQSIASLSTAIELPKLSFAEGARFDSEVEENQPKCLGATRIDIRRQIAEWADNPDGPCIFWLHGMAGTGKSTISRTIARLFDDTGQLGASFFFKRGEGDRGDSKRFFTTIAAQLAYNFPTVKPFIVEAIKGDPAISDKSLKYHFEQLIKRPLSAGIRDASTVVLVIDALDECKEESISNVLTLLKRAVEVKPVRLRIFLTSRPDGVINEAFLDDIQVKRSRDFQDIALEDIPSTREDLSTYFASEFAKMKRKPIKDGPNWPGDVIIEELARMAEPSFIFAATICRFIGDKNWFPEKQLKVIRESQLAGQVSQLDQTYLPVLTQLSSGLDLLEEQYHKLLETIILLADPLSAPALTTLLNADEMDLEIIRLRLQRLHSVLRIPANEVSPIRIFHLSFREFLVDPQKRAKYWFSVDEQTGHGNIASKCLQLMSRKGSLKMDICERKEPGVARSEVGRQVVDEHLAPEVQYACQYWVYHVEKSEGHFRDVQAVLIFLQTHLLHWFEALSWMGRISEGVTMIMTLRSLFDVSHCRLSDLAHTDPKLDE